MRVQQQPQLVAPSDSVTDDLGCPRCGYNLRTLMWSGVCPECDLPVIAASHPHGWRLADVRSLRRVRYSIGLMVLSGVLAPLNLLLLKLISSSNRTGSAMDGTAFPFRWKRSMSCFERVDASVRTTIQEGERLWFMGNHGLLIGWLK